MCRTSWSEFARPENQELIDFYRANEKLCTVTVLGLGISHGMVFLSLTKIDDYPDGLLSEFVSKAKLMWDWINSSQKV